VKLPVTLPCGATLDITDQNDYHLYSSLPGVSATLDGLRVASYEQARKIIDRPARRPYSGVGEYELITERPDGGVMLSGVELTHAEAQAMLNGRNPVLVLLPPGKLHVVPVDMREIWELK
jgi:hypothetical protein